MLIPEVTFQEFKETTKRNYLWGIDNIGYFWFIFDLLFFKRLGMDGNCSAAALWYKDVCD